MNISNSDFIVLLKQTSVNDEKKEKLPETFREFIDEIVKNKLENLSFVHDIKNNKIITSIEELKQILIELLNRTKDKSFKISKKIDKSDEFYVIDDNVVFSPEQLPCIFKSDDFAYFANRIVMMVKNKKIWSIKFYHDTKMDNKLFTNVPADDQHKPLFKATELNTVFKADEKIRIDMLKKITDETKLSCCNYKFVEKLQFSDINEHKDDNIIFDTVDNTFYSYRFGEQKMELVFLVEKIIHGEIQIIKLNNQQKEEGEFKQFEEVYYLLPVGSCRDVAGYFCKDRKIQFTNMYVLTVDNTREKPYELLPHYLEKSNDETVNNINKLINCNVISVSDLFEYIKEIHAYHMINLVSKKLYQQIEEKTYVRVILEDFIESMICNVMKDVDVKIVKNEKTKNNLLGCQVIVTHKNVHYDDKSCCTKNFSADHKWNIDIGRAIVPTTLLEQHGKSTITYNQLKEINDTKTIKKEYINFEE